MKKNGMRVTSLFLAAVMLASAPVTASAADTPANVEGEVVVDQTSQDQTSAESQNQAGRIRLRQRRRISHRLRQRRTLPREQTVIT